MKQFLNEHFDKLLLSAFLFILAGAIISAFRHNENPEVFQWLSRAFDEFQGALLGLITGVAIGKSMSNINKDDGTKSGDTK